MKIQIGSNHDYWGHSRSILGVWRGKMVLRTTMVQKMFAFILHSCSTLDFFHNACTYSVDVRCSCILMTHRSSFIQIDLLSVELWSFDFENFIKIRFSWFSFLYTSRYSADFWCVDVFWWARDQVSFRLTYFRWSYGLFTLKNLSL